MSTVKSSNEHLTFNADGTAKNILFQSNGTQKASISSAGLFTSTTIDATVLTGNLPALNGSALTNLPITGKLNLSGGAMTGAITTNSTFDGRDVAADGVLATNALPKAGGAMTGTITNFRSTGIDDNADALAITIDATENIGIGVVPEDWHSAYDGGIVQINSHGAIFSAGAETYLTNNVYEPQSGGMKYINTNVATLYSQQTGIHHFKTAASGSSDAAITWIDAMTIKADGKVGIGTTAPYTALHTKGSSSGQSSVNSAYNNFTIENDSTAGMSILTGTSSIGGIVFGDSGDNDIGKIEYAHSGNSMRFTVNAAEAMRITDNGTIGIGNNIPNTFSVNANNLVVGSGSGSEGITIYSGNSSAGNIFFADSADNNEETRGGVSYQHNGNKMQFRVNDENRIEIMSDGKVGIGHSSPPSQLTIQGGVEYRTAPAPGSGTLDIRDTGAEGGAGPVGNHGGGIVLGVTAGKGFCGIKAGLGDGGGNTAGHMKFYTRGATGDTHMSERMRIEYNGRVQINGVQASPASGGNLVVESNSGNGAAMTLVGDSNVSAGFGNKVVALNFSAKNYLAYNNPGVWAQIRAENGNGSYSDRGQLVFSTGYGGSTINDHMNLYSEGHLTLGHASNAPASQGSSSELTFYNNGNFYTISNNSRISASSERQTFRSAGTQVGAISAGGSSTSYGTSSDYRLKENVNYSWDATTILKQLKPARFNWISDDTNTLVDGFIAHEAADVVPDSVFGIKDAMAPETYYVDGDELPAGKVIGDVKTYSSSEIKPQQLDQSKLVPLLVKTIQELEARLTAGGL